MLTEETTLNLKYSKEEADRIKKEVDNMIKEIIGNGQDNVEEQEIEVEIIQNEDSG